MCYFVTYQSHRDPISTTEIRSHQPKALNTCPAVVVRTYLMSSGTYNLRMEVH